MYLQSKVKILKLARLLLLSLAKRQTDHATYKFFTLKCIFERKKNCFLGLVITNIDFLSHENSDFSKPQKIMPWIFKLYNQWDISKETLTLFLLWWCPSGQTNKIRCQLILTNDFHSKWLIIVMIKMRLKTEVVITLCSMGWNNFWGEFSSILKFIHLHFCDLLKIFILQ